jgi:hypothetical protein
MSLTVPCLHCQSPVDVTGTAAGQFVTCARCGTRFPGPNTANPDQAPEAAAQSAVFPWWAWLGIGLLCLLLFLPMLDMAGGTRSPTMGNYQRIRAGMTYPQVESLLGSPGHMNPQIGHFEWKMADGRTIVVQLEFGRMADAESRFYVRSKYIR